LLWRCLVLLNCKAWLVEILQFFEDTTYVAW
jgi:hypothetical protein